MDIFLTVVLPILVAIACVAIVTLLTRKELKKYTSQISTGVDVTENVLEVADCFTDSPIYDDVKNIVLDAIYAVEEISKTEDMTSDEKCDKAYEIFEQIADNCKLNTETISKETIQLIIKASVNLINKQFNNK